MIGIMGAGPKTGATHLAVWTANYLTGAAGRRTAVIEWNSHGDFQRMERACMGRKTENAYFTALEADYYKRGDARVLAECVDGPYDDVVIDFGEWSEAGEAAWLCCQVRLLTVSLSEWQFEQGFGRMERGGGPKKSWKCLAAFGSEEARREAERRLGLPVLRIPFSADAFQIDRSAMDWFGQFL